MPSVKNHILSSIEDVAKTWFKMLFEIELVIQKIQRKRDLLIANVDTHLPDRRRSLASNLVGQPVFNRNINRNKPEICGIIGGGIPAMNLVVPHTDSWSSDGPRGE